MMDEKQMHEIVEKQRAYFRSGKTRTREARAAALKRLYNTVKAHEKDIAAALQTDFCKSDYETYLCETGLLLNEIAYQMRHLRAFMRERPARPALAQLPARCFTSPEPYGVALILAPWNYPLLLSLSPLAGAVAAGNCAIVKPSAYAPHTSRVIAAIIKDAFPAEHVTAVEGGRAENRALLGEKFDYIFFTGSPAVGKEVMRAAAENLTPVTLELGGKSPVIIDGTADIRAAARRVAFGKVLNAGQTCVAPDYALIHESVVSRFLAEYRKVLSTFFPDGDMHDMPVIVNEKHFWRLTKLLAGSIEPASNLIIGGRTFRESRFIEPTVLCPVRPDAPVMQEEIFGPILPVLPYHDLADAIRFVQERPRPLALYLFTRDRKTERRVFGSLSFGGGCISDTILHLATPHMGFGGVGDSGMGQYHGKKSFETFTHERSILRRPAATLFDNPLRYHPYSKRKAALLHRFLR